MSLLANDLCKTDSLCFESGVMMSPKCRLSTLIFADLCFKQSFFIKM